MTTKVSKYKMQCIAYYLMDMFKNWWPESWEGSTPKLALEGIGYDEYHNFAKVRIPFNWYEDLLDLLDTNESEVLVEVARVKGLHFDDLHYHKISHAICVILGEETGFNSPDGGLVQIGSKSYVAREGMECYFPTGCHHTFHGGMSRDLYFISVQSPPLLTEDNDDFYFVEDKSKKIL